MSLSVIDAQREIIIQTIRAATRGDWKVLVLDESSKRLVDNVVAEDDILNENITHIELIEQKRPPNPNVDAVYLLSPQSHIVDCVMADFDRRRYHRSNLIWTSLLHPDLRDRIDKSHIAREQIATFKVLNIDFYPKESHLVTFRDPWEFPILFHPACNNLVRKQMEDIAQKIVGVCVALGEYPSIRYYKPAAPRHEAAVLCSHLARFVQDELDLYAKFHEDFPPVTGRPRGLLYIVDRSIDVAAPLLHEFTYQAMAFDLLPIKEGNKTTYQTIVNEGRHNEEVKEVEISERDRIWVENRHQHMKDTIEKLMGDFQRFIDSNPHFTQKDSDNATSLNAIKDMMAGLPQFQEMKEAYSLHLSMAQECMNKFEKQKLPDVASIEQILATGLDEDYRKPKNLTDQVVRTLDDDAVTPLDRLRLLALYLVYRDGVLTSDLERLLQHAKLPLRDMDVLLNMSFLGVQTSRKLKEVRGAPLPLFPPKIPINNQAAQAEYALSRFEPALKSLLAGHAAATLDAEVFPYTKPPLDDGQQVTVSATSLRTAKPTWAKKTTSSAEPRQRVIVYVAGGATFSEARACYESSAKHGREVVLVTSHMQTPGLFIRQVNDLSAEKRQLGLPSQTPQPPPKWVLDGSDRAIAAVPAPNHEQNHHGGARHDQARQDHGHGSSQLAHEQNRGPSSASSNDKPAGPRRGQGFAALGPRAIPPPTAVRSPSIVPTSEFEQSARTRPPEPPSAAMAAMRLDSGSRHSNGSGAGTHSPIRLNSPSPSSGSPAMLGQQGKFSVGQPAEKKKKHHFFGKKKD